MANMANMSINITEVLLAIHLAEKGIAFERQYHFVPGRKFRADFALLEPRILIEVQGGVYNRRAHGSITGIVADNERGNFACLHNWKVFRFTPDQVNSGEAIEWIRKTLGENIE